MTKRFYLWVENGQTFHVYLTRLKCEFPYTEGRANPWLWFVKDEDDLLVTGVPTRREALELAGLSS